MSGLKHSGVLHNSYNICPKFSIFVPPSEQHALLLQGQIFNLLCLRKFDLFQLPQNEKHAYQLDTGVQVWPLILTLALTLAVNFLNAKYSIFYTATSFSVVRSFWDFARSTAVILPCSGQDFEAVGRRSDRLWADGASRDLGLGWVTDGCPI